LLVLLSKERKDLFMQAIFTRFGKGNSGVLSIKYGLIAVALMLIGIGAWVVAPTPRVAASTQIGVNPLQMMTSAKDLPATHYDF
jgi:hypothetical protein